MARNKNDGQENSNGKTFIPLKLVEVKGNNCKMEMHDLVYVFDDNQHTAKELSDGIVQKFLLGAGFSNVSSQVIQHTRTFYMTFLSRLMIKIIKIMEGNHRMDIQIIDVLNACRYFGIRMYGYDEQCDDEKLSMGVVCNFIREEANLCEPDGEPLEQQHMENVDWREYNLTGNDRWEQMDYDMSEVDETSLSCIHEIQDIDYAQFLNFEIEEATVDKEEDYIGIVYGTHERWEHRNQMMDGSFSSSDEYLHSQFIIPRLNFTRIMYKAIQRTTTITSTAHGALQRVSEYYLHTALSTGALRDQLFTILLTENLEVVSDTEMEVLEEYNRWPSQVTIIMDMTLHSRENQKLHENEQQYNPMYIPTKYTTSTKQESTKRKWNKQIETGKLSLGEIIEAHSKRAKVDP